MLALSVLLAWLILRSGVGRLPREPQAPLLSPQVNGALAFAMIVAGVLGASTVMSSAGITRETVAAGGDAGLRASALLQAGTYTAQAVVALVWVVLLAGTGWRPWRTTRAPAAVAAGLVVLVVSWPFVVTTVELGSVAQQLIRGQPIEPLAHQTLQLLDRGEGVWVTVVTALALLAAPVLEEILYRGMLHGMLRSAGIGPWPVVVGVSVIFATMHAGAVPAAALGGLFVLSLALGWARESTGSLTVPIVAHMGFNGANLALARWAMGT